MPDNSQSIILKGAVEISQSCHVWSDREVGQRGAVGRNRSTGGLRQLDFSYPRNLSLAV